MKILKFIFGIIVLFITLKMGVDLAQHPEKYSTTLKYQLKNDILAGDSDAIQYYNENYVNQGIKLYNEEIFENV